MFKSSTQYPLYTWNEEWMDYYLYSFTSVNIPIHQLQTINIMPHVFIVELSSFLCKSHSIVWNTFSEDLIQFTPNYV
jgi:hypothetical protein